MVSCSFLASPGPLQEPGPAKHEKLWDILKGQCPVGPVQATILILQKHFQRAKLASLLAQ